MPFPLSPVASWTLIAGLALVVWAVAIILWPARPPRSLGDELRAAGYTVVEDKPSVRVVQRRPFDWQRDDPFAAGTRRGAPPDGELPS